MEIRDRTISNFFIIYQYLSIFFLFLPILLFLSILFWFARANLLSEQIGSKKMQRLKTRQMKK
jgi:ATP-dependent Zn protease